VASCRQKEYIKSYLYSLEIRLQNELTLSEEIEYNANSVFLRNKLTIIKEIKEEIFEIFRMVT